MKLSQERLLREAGTTGFRPESLEKVIRLIGLLNGVFRDSFLRDRLVLKGGTALNLFLFEVPRLSVDIDLNYIGSEDRAGTESERPTVEAHLQAILEKDDFTVRRVPTDHAGGKWQLRYSGAQGPGGNLEVDLNFMHRIPLCPLEVMDSRVLGSYQAMNIPVLGLNDLAAGKLIALMDRSAARDVFDAAGLFEHPALDMAQLRLPFVVMGAMSRKLDLRAVRPDSVRMEEGEFDRMVRPLLRSRADPLNLVGMLEKARAGLSGLLPLLPKEVLFVEALWDRGEIYPEWLTSDPDMQRRILATPMLQWKAQHVRKHHGLDG